MAVANATTPRQLAFQQWRQMVIAAHKQRAYLHPPWRAKFENFLNDMQEPPPGTRLLQWQPEKGFIPENCYWG